MSRQDRAAYEAPDGGDRVEGLVQGDTIWLTLAQMGHEGGAAVQGPPVLAEPGDATASLVTELALAPRS